VFIFSPGEIRVFFIDILWKSLSRDIAIFFDRNAVGSLVPVNWVSYVDEVSFSVRADEITVSF